VGALGGQRLGAAQMCWAAPHSNLCYGWTGSVLLRCAGLHLTPICALCMLTLSLCTSCCNCISSMQKVGRLGAPQACWAAPHPNLCALCMLTPTSVHCACSPQPLCIVHAPTCVHCASSPSSLCTCPTAAAGRACMSRRSTLAHIVHVTSI